MARVPVYSPQVSANGLPGARQTPSAPRPIPLGAEQAEQQMRLGQTISQGANLVGNILIQKQEEANQLRVADAVNKAKSAAMRYTYDPQQGYLGIKGESALTRQSGKALSDEYTEMLDKDLQGIADSLGNDRQRALFNQARASLGASFREQVMRHEIGEFKSHEISVYQGTVANRTQEIGMAYNNPALIEENINSIKSSVWKLGQLQGWSASEIEAKQRSATSVAHKTAIAAALQTNNVAYANQYLERNSTDMEVADILAAQKLITVDLDAKIGMGAVQQAVQSVMPRFVPTDLDRLANLDIGDITEQDWFKALDASKVKAESNGKRFKEDGTILEGPYVPGQGTAKGDHQVMDATNTDPGFKVTPARDDSAEERARVGRDYMAAMVKEYRGNLPMALAAYNAGPGNVNKALKKAKKAGDETNWMNYLPQPEQTIPYVKKIMADFTAGKGKPAPPTLVEFQNDAIARLGPNATAAQQKNVLDMSKKQYDAITASIKQRDDSAVANAMRELQTNGGSYAELPLQVKAAIPPEKVDELIEYGKKINKVETNPAVYQRLSDPAELASLTEDQFYALRMALSEADWKQFAKQRGGNLADTEKLNTPAIDRAMKNRLAELGINPNPKADTDEYRQLGVIRSIIDKTILGEQAVAKKQFNDTEIEKHIDMLWSTSAELQNAWYTRRERLLTLEPGDIPSGDRRAIVASYQRMGLPEPDDYEVLRIYIAGQLARGAN